MSEELSRSFTVLAERGVPRGARQVLQDARQNADPAPARARPPRRTPVLLGAVALVLVLVGALVVLARPFDGEEPSTAVTQPPGTVEPPRDTPTDWSPPIALIPAPDVDPVQVSTVIGDLKFTTLQLPEDLWGPIVDDLAATPFGPAALVNSSLWWSTDGETWWSVPTTVDAQRLTVVNDDIVVFGDDGATRFGWDGAGWIEQQRLDLPVPADQIAFGPSGAVAVSQTRIYYSSDGAHFDRAEHGPDSEVFRAEPWVPPEDRDFGDCRATFSATANRNRAVLATDDGFVALTSAQHPDGLVCEPLLWFSTDGNTWNLVSPDSPFGTDSTVDTTGSRIAFHDGRFVVTGVVGGQGRADTEGAVWVSDDGLAWRRADIEFGFPLSVAGGELGWMLTGVVETEGDAVQGVWFSTDGLTWRGPHSLPWARSTGWFWPRLAITSDTITWTGHTDSMQVVVVGQVRQP